MRQDLEFGEMRACSANSSECLSRCARRDSTLFSSYSFTSFTSSSSSSLCAFLIDTLPIRNTLNSFDCNIGARSNRHSSEPLRSHQNCAAHVAFELIIGHANGPRIVGRNGHHARIARMTADAAAIAANIENVRERVVLARKSAAERLGRAAAEVKIIAVSKTFSVAAIRAAYDAGVRDFGENRVQEWESKRAQLADLDATFHMLGHVQSNKALRVAQLFHRADSLDSLALAKKLDAAAATEKKRLPVLIEVHLSGEESKSGVTEADLASLAEATSSLAHLDLQGLMTIPPYFDDSERARPYFRKLRELRDGLAAKLGRELPVLSMGMSHDFEVAIEEGATEVRVGSAIFGGRERKA
jgi:pyridoxal phosphate enzyme (YggS family)